jgi:hypothetical protein
MGTRNTSAAQRGFRRAGRWPSAALAVGATLAVLASPLTAGTASAAVNGSIAFDAGQQNQNVPSGSVVHVTGTYSGFTGATNVSFSVTSGPDAPVVIGGLCPPNGAIANSFDCSYQNTIAGNPDNPSDTVAVTADDGNNADGPVVANATVTFTSIPPIANDTSVSIASVQPAANQRAGMTTVINATYAPVPAAGQSAPQIEFTVLNGPDAPAPAFFEHGQRCVTQLTGTAQCFVHNVGGPGQDLVEVFADNTPGNVWDPNSEPGSQTTLTFSGPPAAVSLSPHSLTATTATCSVFKVTATDSSGQQSTFRQIIVLASETEPDAVTNSPFTFYNVDSSGTCTTQHFSTQQPSTNDNTVTHSLNEQASYVTGPDGTVMFGIVSTMSGSGSITATSQDVPTVSDTASASWSPGGPGAVARLAAVPGSRTGYTSTQQSFQVRATDAGSNPVQGVTVNEEVTTGPDRTGNPVPCGLTDQNGNVTCQITNGGVAGVDALTFWVNNCTTTCTNGPDSGEPQTNATATFNAQPAVSSANSTMTCIDQHVGANQGKPVTTCSVSTAQQSVVFSATVKDANGSPLSGVTVDFKATAGTLGGNALTPSTLPTGSAPTDQNGVARFTVANPSAKDGDTVTVQAKVGTAAIGSATANWKDPKPSALTVTPQVQSVTKGGLVSVTARVTDQFGNGWPVARSLQFNVTGRNNGTHATASTDASGAAVFSYTDTAPANSGTTFDTIAVTDPADSLGANASVLYINGSTTADTVKVDASGFGTTDGACGANAANPATNLPLGQRTEICALVKNASGETLAGKTVTFRVNVGQVDAHGGLTSTSGASYQAVTDASGVAFADLTSTKPGSQGVSATADNAIGSAAVTYASPAVASARNVTITPAAPTVPAGGTQKFVVMVTDAYGNAVPNVSLTYTQSGPGSINGTSSGALTTAADGTASVVLTTASTDTGSGSVVATITSSGTQCGLPAGNPAGATAAGSCTATSTYTVSTAPTPSSVTVTPEQGVTAGGNEFVGAKVLNSDGTPAANQVVRFTVSGANSATGTATTRSNGIAVFGYVARNAGTDVVNAYDDLNNSGVHDTGEPSGSADVTIARSGGGSTGQRPTITLTAGHHGRITIHVTSHPLLIGARVVYFIKQRGAFHRLGSTATGNSGRTQGTFNGKPGEKYTFRVSVGREGFSATKSIRAKR